MKTQFDRDQNGKKGGKADSRQGLAGGTKEV